MHPSRCSSEDSRIIDGAKQGALPEIELEYRLNIGDLAERFSPICKAFHRCNNRFVSQCDQNSESRAIIGSVISLAKILDLHVIAEGIETREQYKILHGLGCDFGQGFLFSRPAPTTRAETLLSNPPHWGDVLKS